MVINVDANALELFFLYYCLWIVKYYVLGHLIGLILFPRVFEATFVAHPRLPKVYYLYIAHYSIVYTEYYVDDTSYENLEILISLFEISKRPVYLHDYHWNHFYDNSQSLDFSEYYNKKEYKVIQSIPETISIGYSASKDDYSH